METTKQVSVFLENKPGRLAQVLLALAREKVNVVALTIMDSHEHSVLRLVTNDLPKTLQVLDGLNWWVEQSPCGRPKPDGEVDRFAKCPTCWHGERPTGTNSCALR